MYYEVMMKIILAVGLMVIFTAFVQGLFSIMTSQGNADIIESGWHELFRAIGIMILIIILAAVLWMMNRTFYDGGVGERPGESSLY